MAAPPHVNLWETKSFADVTVVSCEKYEIPAHKSIICVRNRFFDNCLRTGFVESVTGRVSLTEEFDIIEGLLQHMYGVEVTLLRPLDAQNTNVESKTWKLNRLIALYVCADKYGVADLQEKVAQGFSSRLASIDDPAIILNIATVVYDQTAFFDVQLRSGMIKHVQAHLDTILSTDESASTLLGIAELNLDILKRAAPVLQQQAQAVKSGSAPTPKKRKSPRIPQHTPGTYALRVHMS
ncbi:hypothetical protein SLS55_006927 [Diplodia seriata]|uniref:BTB domain-containing protein n=1 Tax=Diplodia seriata TaxID=420778 RepID=A0ABR3CB62_9PEZI